MGFKKTGQAVPSTLHGKAVQELQEHEQVFYKTRQGLFFHVHSGKKFYPLDCGPEDIEIEDIAHALSHICRYGGHSRWHYSVAQHSVLVSHLVSAPNALWGLLHDAGEAYVGDVVKPLKVNLPEFSRFEALVVGAVQRRFNLPEGEPDEVKLVDSQILHAEAKALLGFDPVEKGWALPAPLENPPKIERWTPEEAKSKFLARFHELYTEAEEDPPNQ